MPSLERPVAPNPHDLLPPLPAFELASDDIADGATLGRDFIHGSAGGRNQSPHLRWSGAPAGTKGYAVTCYDPDAPTGSGFWHWVLIGVPSETSELARDAGGSGELPAGAFHVRNDFGTADYGGAAPPAGDRPHRYIFSVYALDTDDLGLDASATPAIVGFNLTFHALARGSLTATYEQP